MEIELETLISKNPWVVVEWMSDMKILPSTWAFKETTPELQSSVDMGFPPC
jgi:hypothetical protein